MSINATSYVLNHRFGSATRKLIMIGIADFANDSGEAWPSIDTLAQRAECSRRTVQETIRLLEKDGDLQIRPNAGQNGCHRYRIIFRKKEALYTPRKPASPGGADSAPPRTFEQVQMSAAQTAGGGADERRDFAHEPLGTVKELSERESARPRTEFSEEEFCDTTSFITGLRPGWDTAFSAKERTAFSANAAAIRSITPAQRETIRRFLAARLPQGHAYWQPKTRFQFLTDSTDVLAHALDWQSKQPAPASKRPRQPLQTPEEKAQAERDLAEWLSEQANSSTAH